MKIQTYTAEQSKDAKCPFGDAYTLDGSVYYHGTSSLAEGGIEREGFIWSENTCTLEEINSVTHVFDQLHWTGSHNEGFAVLRGFTQSDFDLGNGNSKGISFARTSARAMLYASKEWSGGETARALRLAFEDLDRYLEDPKFRQKQMQQSWQELRSRFGGIQMPKDCKPKRPEELCFEHIRNLWRFYSGFPRVKIGVEPVAFNTGWLHSELRELKPLRDRVCRLTAAYQYGVVYAVRFLAGDIANAVKRTNGELYLQQLLPSKGIIAKAIVPAEVNYNPAHIYRNTKIHLATM